MIIFSIFKTFFQELRLFSFIKIAMKIIFMFGSAPLLTSDIDASAGVCSVRVFCPLSYFSKSWGLLNINWEILLIYLDSTVLYYKFNYNWLVELNILLNFISNSTYFPLSLANFPKTTTTLHCIFITIILTTGLTLVIYDN